MGVGDPSTRSRAIEGVATSVTAFVGPEAGVSAQRVTSDAELDADPGSELATAVRLFFAQGGRAAWVARDVRQLEAVTEVGLLALPGETDRDRLRAALDHAATHRAFLLVDPPGDDREETVGLVRTLRDEPGRANAAVYFPRLALGGGRTCAPSGAVAGVAARIDERRGVWRPPAGPESSLDGIEGPTVALDEGEAERLNAAHVNAIRAFPRRGTLVWGARTIAEPSSDWKYVSVRRLALYLERSIDEGLWWAVFEPNDEPLWEEVRRRAEEFLYGLFRAGALSGRAADEAFFVRCGPDTMTPDDVESGRLVVTVGFAPARPAEFVVVRIGKLVAA